MRLIFLLCIVKCAQSVRKNGNPSSVSKYKCTFRCVIGGSGTNTVTPVTEEHEMRCDEGGGSGCMLRIPILGATLFAIIKWELTVLFGGKRRSVQESAPDTISPFLRPSISLLAAI